MKKINFIICAYRGEEYNLPLVVKSTLSAFGERVARISIIDDRHDPLTKKVVDKLLSESDLVHYARSRIDRRGNLNGLDWISEFLALGASQAAGSGAEYVLKLDPDTLILKPEMFLSPIDRGHVSISCTSLHSLHSGMAYCFESKLILPLLTLVSAMNSSEDINTLCDYPEDNTIMSLVSALSGGRDFTHYNLTDPRVSDHIGAFDTSKLLDAKEYRDEVIKAAQCSLVTVGNTGLLGQEKCLQYKILLDILRAKG